MAKKDREMERRRTASRIKQAAKREAARQKKAQRRAQDQGITLAPRVNVSIKSRVFAESVFADLERR